MIDKTYRAVRHDVVREKQRNNADEVHHPEEKTEQIKRILLGKNDLKILELFSGQGNLTKIYKNYSKTIECYDKKLKTGDSFILFHKLIYERKKYDVIDIDPYGFPNRFFPDIFLLIDSGYMFITMPKPYVNILNGITKQHLTCYYGEYNPGLETIIEKIKLYGLCHWRSCEEVDIVDLGRLWRIALKVEKVKATDYTGTKNR